MLVAEIPFQILQLKGFQVMGQFLLQFVGYFMISIWFILMVSEKRWMQMIFIERLARHQGLAEVTKYVVMSQLEEDYHCEKLVKLGLMELVIEIEFERYSNQ